MYTPPCQWDLPSMEKMGRRCALNSIRHFMGFVRVLELSGSTSLQNSRSVDWNNQSLTHACSLFVGPDVICVVYVDNLIFWLREIPWINWVAMALHELDVNLEKEGNAMGFLGVTLDCNAPTGLLEMKQTGLFK